MKNVILVAVLAVTLTAACLGFFLPNNQAPVLKDHDFSAREAGNRHDTLVPVLAAWRATEARARFAA
jgi:hypothetical protein